MELKKINHIYIYIYIHIHIVSNYKNNVFLGSLGAQSVEHPTLGFGSGHDLTVL